MGIKVLNKESRKEICYPEASASEIFKRMKSLLAFEKDVELADYLGIRTGQFSLWKKRNTIPLDLIIHFAKINNWNLNYLLLGK